MSDALGLAIVAAIPPTIAAFAALAVAIYNIQKTTELSKYTVENGKKTDIVAKKTDAVLIKSEQIHTLTNSNLSEVTSSLKLANQKIEDMRTLIASLAQSKAVSEAAPAKAVEKIPGKPTDESLLKVESVEISDTAVAKVDEKTAEKIAEKPEDKPPLKKG